jgi:hypothetical protein
LPFEYTTCGATKRAKLEADIAKGMNVTHFKAEMARCEALIAGYNANLAAAVKTVEDGVVSLKREVDASVTYAVKRLGASVALVTRKTSKACLEGIFEALEESNEEVDLEADAAVAAAEEGEAAAGGGGLKMKNVAEKSKAVMSKMQVMGAATLTNAHLWLSSNVGTHNLKAAAVRATLAAKVKIAGVRGVSHEDMFLEVLTDGHKADLAIVRKVLFRIKGFAGNHNAGLVPATYVCADVVMAAVSGLVQAGALSPAGVAGFEANLAIAHARDQAIAKLAAEAIPSLEQLLAKAEKVVLEFYEVRELTLEVATLSADMMKVVEKKGEGAGDDIHHKITAARAKLGVLIDSLCAVAKSDEEDTAAAEAAGAAKEAASVEAVKQLFDFRDTNGVVDGLVAAMKSHVLVTIPAVLGGGGNTVAA